MTLKGLILEALQRRVCVTGFTESCVAFTHMLARFDSVWLTRVSLRVGHGRSVWPDSEEVHLGSGWTGNGNLRSTVWLGTTKLKSPIYVFDQQEHFNCIN